MAAVKKISKDKNIIFLRVSSQKKYDIEFGFDIEKDSPDAVIKDLIFHLLK